MGEKYNPSEPDKLSDEEWVTGLMGTHGLPVGSSIEVVSAVATSLWEDRGTRLDSIALVLGRRVDPDEIANDRDIQGAYFAPDPVVAVGRALNIRAQAQIDSEG